LCELSSGGGGSKKNAQPMALISTLNAHIISTMKDYDSAGLSSKRAVLYEEKMGCHF
jgi:hypothetical protein